MRRRFEPDRRSLVPSTSDVYGTEDGWRRFYHFDLDRDPEGHFEPLSAREMWAEAATLEAHLAWRITAKVRDELITREVTAESWILERIKRLKARLRQRKAA